MRTETLGKDRNFASFVFCCTSSLGNSIWHIVATPRERIEWMNAQISLVSSSKAGRLQVPGRTWLVEISSIWLNICTK